MSHRDSETQAALAAMHRARLRAEEIAAATGTALVQWIDGKMVLTYPTRREYDGMPRRTPPLEEP